MIYGSAEFKHRLLNMLVNSSTYFTSEQKQDQEPQIYNDPYKHFAYRIACSHADDMAVHLYGDLPYKILNRVRPREDPETKAYRLQSYETITKSTADKALSIVAKVFNPSLYSIRFDENNDKADMLEDYAMNDYPYCGSVINYLHEVGLRKMIADPNGVFVVKPSTYPTDQVTRVQPIIKIFGSKNIWFKDLESYLIFIRCQTVQDTLVFFFEWYDKTQIVEFSAYVVNPNSDTEKGLMITESVVYPTGFLPVWELKGNTEVQDNGIEIHKSFFEPAVSFWNKAINHESDLDGAYINHMHPIRTELATECDYIQDKQRCRNGWIVSATGGDRMACPGCNGTGYKSVKSPFGVYRIDPSALSGDKATGMKAVEYINIPTDATKMLEQRIETLLEKGLYALNMDVVNKIGENQSGKAKVIDRGELYDFLYKIGSVVFDTHAYNIFHYFNLFMFGVEALNQGQEYLSSIEPEIAKPTMFDITTAVEMISEYKNSKDAGINPSYLKVKQLQINSKEFASDEDLKERLNLILECDPLPQITPDQIIANSLEGWYRKYDPIIHANIESFVKRALEEFPKEKGVEESGFCGMDDSKRYEILVKYAKEVEKDNMQTIQPTDPNNPNAKPVIDPNNPEGTQNASEQILNQAIVSHVARGMYGK